MIQTLIAQFVALEDPRCQGKIAHSPTPHRMRTAMFCSPSPTAFV